MPKDLTKAMQVVSDFVNREDHSLGWHNLALGLVEPLAIKDHIEDGQIGVFSRQAEAGMRAEWPRIV